MNVLDKLPKPKCKSCGDELTTKEFEYIEGLKNWYGRKAEYQCYQCSQKEIEEVKRRWANR